MNRLTVLVTLPVHSRIPDYVEYLANEIKKVSDMLAVAVNGTISRKQKKELEQIADCVLARENRDYDVGAYREMIFCFMKDGQMDSFDEVILMNDSFYGPFFPFCDIFDKMEGSEADFWGLSAYPNSMFRGYIPVQEHLQSYFLVVRGKLLHSKDFEKFWKGLPDRIPSRQMAIECFEKKFTAHFVSLGYTWDAYIDSSIFVSEEPGFNYNLYDFSSYEMIAEHRFPVLKRSMILLRDMEQLANWDDAARILQFIDRHTSYDVNLILNDLLSRFDTNMLKNCLRINFIVPEEKNMFNSGMRDDINEKRVLKKCALIVINSRAGEVLEQVLKQIPADVFQICDAVWGEELKSVTLEKIRKYCYMCFVDFNSFSGTFYCKKRSSLNHLVSNLLKSRSYVEGIISRFQTYKRIGVLFAKDPTISDIFNSQDKLEWREAGHESVAQVIKEMGLDCAVSSEWMPDTGMRSFWCRTKFFMAKEGFEILQKMIQGSTKEVRCIPYLAQYHGFFTGEVSSVECAQERLNSCQIALNSIVDATMHVIQADGLYDYHIKLCQNIMRNDVVEFCRKYEYIYIYGAGEYGGIFADLLHQENIYFECFVVSQGQYRQEQFLNKRVAYINEIQADPKHAGILLAVPPQARSAVELACGEYGYQHFYYFPVRIANI